MKQSARKSSQLSLVPPATERSDPPEVSSPLDDFFDGWLSSVSREVLETPVLKNQATTSAYGQRPLTSTDLIRVNRATVRESADHRHWPPDVVEKFRAAQVIPRKR